MQYDTIVHPDRPVRWPEEWACPRCEDGILIDDPDMIALQARLARGEDVAARLPDEQPQPATPPARRRPRVLYQAPPSRRT